MKKKLTTLVLLLIVASTTWANEQYDFSAQCGTNTLYFKITNDEVDAKEVEIVTMNAFPPYYITSPTGTLILPETVEYNDTDYNVTSIGIAAFVNCSGLSGNLTIPNSVKSIGINAFMNCTGLAGTLVLGENVKSIASNAFNNCNFTGSLTIPNSVESIGDCAFVSKFSAFEVGASNTNYSAQDGVLYSNDLTTLVIYPIGKTLTTFTVPSGVTSIGNSAFVDCEKLESITLPSELSSIGDDAFFDCSNLENIILPGGLLSIGDNAFSYCSMLSALTFPSSLGSIGLGAFQTCTNLSNITMLSATPPSIGMFAFDEINSEACVTVPAGSVDAYDNDISYSNMMMEFDEADDGKWCGMSIEEAPDVPTAIEQAQASSFIQVGNTILFAQPTAVAVYNIGGVMLYSGSATSCTLESAGVYMVRTAQVSRKIVVNDK